MWKDRELLYRFIEYYTESEIDRFDLKAVADKYLEENENKNTK